MSEAATRCPATLAARSSLQRRGDRGAVEAFAADDDEAGRARLAVAPGAVEIMLQPLADALHHLAELLAGHVEEALEAENVVRRDHRAEAGEEVRGIGDRAARHDEALEIIMVVPGFEVVTGGPGREGVLGAGRQPQPPLVRHRPTPR